MSYRIVCVTKARRRVSRVKLDLTARNKEAFAQAAEEAVRIDLLRGIERFKQRLPKAKLDEAFNARDYAAARKLIPWDSLPNDLAKATDKVAGLIDETHGRTVEAITEAPEAAYLKDAGNPRLEKHTRKRLSRFLQDLSDEHNEAVQRTIAAATRQGLTPAMVMDRLRNTVGLRTQQNRALASFENGLIEGGKHSKATIRRLVKAKADAMLNQRLRTIAVTETRTAVNTAELESWKAQVADGLLDERAEKVWVIGAEDACPKICYPMDGVAVPLDGSWSLPDGRMVSVVTEAHPNCRCASILRTPDDSDYGSNKQGS